MASAASASLLPSLAVGSVASAPARAECSVRPSANVPAASWRSHQASLSSRQSNNLAFAPLTSRHAGTRRGVKVVAMATGESSDPNEVVTDFLKGLQGGLQEAWDKTEDKLAVSALGFAAFLILWSSTGLISAIDKLPLVPSFFEFVGVLFSGWFVYRYLLFKPDREELVKKIEDTWARITGSER